MKKFLFITTLLLANSLPAQAQSLTKIGWDDSHLRLWRSLQNSGYSTVINPPDPDCNVMSGWYWIRNNRPEVAVCTQDNFGEWDKDTLRHEAIHVIQDCKDGTIGNGVQHMFNDGEHDAIAMNWDLDKMMYVYKEYTGNGESGNNPAFNTNDWKIVRAEVEAFYLADESSADEIAQWVGDSCR